MVADYKWEPMCPKVITKLTCHIVSEKIKILKQWMPASEANHKDVTLHKLAQWERFLQLRRVLVMEGEKGW